MPTNPNPPRGRYLKKAIKTEEQADGTLTADVERMLAEITRGGEAKVLEMAARFDKYTGAIVVTREEMAKAERDVPNDIKQHIRYSHSRVKAFAEAQRRSVSDFEISIGKGGKAGQRIVPMNTAGCYCPGGRYSHIASAIMSVTTARAAGVKTVIMASPPKPGSGIPPAILYAAYLAGADYALNLGGVQAIASMRLGFFTGHCADILVGPGSGFVAESKRQLAGPACAIDLFAGPTEIAIIADGTADAEVVATDLVGQAEHGPTSPVWLITTSTEVGEYVCSRVPEMLEYLPEPNRTSARNAWRDYGEVILAASDADAVRFSDEYAPEHLEVLCTESSLRWWLSSLSSYGSLFLGEGTCVTYGDKASGPNHTLPTRRAANHTGGLSVHKFLKIMTWQEQDTVDHEELAVVSAKISRAEGMEGHAWAADVRLAKHARDPDERRRLLNESGMVGAGTAHLFMDGVGRKARL